MRITRIINVYTYRGVMILTTNTGWIIVMNEKYIFKTYCEALDWIDRWWKLRLN